MRTVPFLWVIAFSPAAGRLQEACQSLKLAARTPRTPRTARTDKDEERPGSGGIVFVPGVPGVPGVLAFPALPGTPLALSRGDDRDPNPAEPAKRPGSRDPGLLSRGHGGL